MYRAALALLVALLVTSLVTANAGPPRKSLLTEHKITTEKEYPDYNFYLVDEKVVAVKFGPKDPIELKAKPKEHYSYLFVAVPKGAEKAFTTEEKLRAALQKAGTIEGQVRAELLFHSSVSVVLGDKRDKAVQEHKVDKIDAKAGIVITTKDIEPKKKDSEKKDSPDEEASGATVYAPRGGTLIAGLAASLGVMLGGLWVVGRAGAGDPSDLPQLRQFVR